MTQGIDNDIIEEVWARDDGWTKVLHHRNGTLVGRWAGESYDRAVELLTGYGYGRVDL